MPRVPCIAAALAVAVLSAPITLHATPISDACVTRPNYFEGMLGERLEIFESPYSAGSEVGVMRSAVFRDALGVLSFAYQAQPLAPENLPAAIAVGPWFRTADVFMMANAVPGFPGPIPALMVPLRVCLMDFGGAVLPGLFIDAPGFGFIPGLTTVVARVTASGFTTGSAFLTLGSTRPRVAALVPASVPEPSTLVLVAGGALILGGVALRRRRAG